MCRRNPTRTCRIPKFCVFAPFDEDCCDSSIQAVIDSFSHVEDIKVPKSSSGNQTNIRARYEPRYKFCEEYNLLRGYIDGLWGVNFKKGDVLFLVAHGSFNKDTVYATSNANLNGPDYALSAKGLCRKLESAGAANLDKIFFAICHSAKQGHCAANWAIQNERSEVYGVGGGYGGGILQNPISITSEGTLTQINSSFVRVT